VVQELKSFALACTFRGTDTETILNRSFYIFEECELVGGHIEIANLIVVRERNSHEIGTLFGILPQNVTALLKYAKFEQLQRRCLQDLPLIKTLLEYLLVIVLGSSCSEEVLFEAPDQGPALSFFFFLRTSFDLLQDPI